MPDTTIQDGTTTNGGQSEETGNENGGAGGGVSTGVYLHGGEPITKEEFDALGLNPVQVQPGVYMDTGEYQAMFAGVPPELLTYNLQQDSNLQSINKNNQDWLNFQRAMSTLAIQYQMESALINTLTMVAIDSSKKQEEWFSKAT
jgi:hypothetical protein